MLSSARLLFEKILAEGAAYLESFVVQGLHETESLDFKSGESLNDEKSTWSEAICGFANNQGGVLIWGIEARKDKTTGIDAACDIIPVKNPAGLRSRLLELLRTAVEPPLAGVEIREFYRAGSSGDGFVVCFIPESDFKPHRAEMLKNKPYMIRISDNFINPSPSLLRSLFYPRTSAQFELEVTVVWEPWRFETNAPNRRVPAEREITHNVLLHNTGLSSAKDIFSIIEVKTDGVKVESTHLNHRRRTSSGIGVEMSDPLHPYSSELLYSLNHSKPLVQVSGDPRSEALVSFLSPIELSVRISATDMPPVIIEAVLTTAALHIARGSKNGST